MRRFVTGTTLTCLLFVAGACERAADQPSAGRDSLAALPADPSSPAAGSDAHDSGAHTASEGTAGGHSATGHAAAGEGGQTLLPIMQKLGSEMTTLTYALMTDDYGAMQRSAAAIADHAPISAEELERIHTTLGADMAKFEAVDESVHVASVRLHEAVQARQRDQIIERLGAVQRGCVSCHAQFRERLLTNRGGQ